MIFTKVNNRMENRMNEEQGFFEKKRIYTHNSYNIMVNKCPSLKWSASIFSIFHIYIGNKNYRVTYSYFDTPNFVKTDAKRKINVLKLVKDDLWLEAN